MTGYRYKAFIEKYFLIDDPKTGQLVPFIFNPVQNAEYELLKAQGIEEFGIGVAIREFILKARREGFSSLILALFAADDILQENPTESFVISYKDEATQTFKKRYRRYVLSWAAQKAGMTVADIQRDPNVLEQIAKQIFSIDAGDMELRHNRAHFFCGTASARTGGRGGVLQKLLFTEPAHYQDTEKMTAREIIEGTMRQIDEASGWVFQESTANGIGNHYEKTYQLIKKGLSRFKLRFFGWRQFYTEEQFKTIASEFTDPDMLKQEYPETEEEAFLSSELSFTNRDELMAMVNVTADKKLEVHLELRGVNYIDQCEMIRDFLITFERTHPNKWLYVGIDSAKDVDKTIVTILVEKELTNLGGVRGIAIDATGAGDFMPDWFEKNSKWHIMRVKFSRATKSIMYKNLRVVIQDKTTSVPEFLIGKDFISDEWKLWFNEMLDLQKQVIGDMLVVAHPVGNEYHDDYPDSWALAEYLWVTINGVTASAKAPEASYTEEAVRRRLTRGTPVRSRRGGDDAY